VNFGVSFLHLRVTEKIEKPIEEVKIYKPDSRVYDLPVNKYKIQPKEVVFLSANTWDVSGGGNYGYNSIWVNRNKNIFDNHDYKPSNEINNLSDNEINELFKYWEEINLLNNCVVHDFLNSKKLIQNYISKYKILICVKYSELLDIENVKLLLSQMSNSNRYVLISDLENKYKLYDLFKVVNLFSKNEITFDDKKIIDSVTSNTSDFFAETSSFGIIEKGSLASFNIFDINSKRLLWKDENYPTLADLDNESLTAVWSSGECVNIKHD